MGDLPESSSAIEWKVDKSKEGVTTYTAACGELQAKVVRYDSPSDKRLPLVTLTQGRVIWYRMTRTDAVHELRRRCERWLHGGPFLEADERQAQPPTPRRTWKR